MVDQRLSDPDGSSRGAEDGPLPALHEVGTFKLAVIVTCFNYAQYVGEAVSSVVSQGCGDCRLLVVDDGSTDESWEVITSLGVSAIRIANGGQRRACLAGLARTTEPFVLFLDADDKLLPGSLQTIIKSLDQGVAKLQFPLERIDAAGRIISGPTPELVSHRGRGAAQQILKTGVYTTPPTSGNVFRRDVCALLEEVDYEKAADGIIIFAAPFMGDVVSLAQPLGQYRVHDRNDSGFADALNQQSLQRDMDRYTRRIDHLRRVLSRTGQAARLIRPIETYFYRERRLYLTLARKQKPVLLDVPGLLHRLWRSPYTLRMKVGMTLFFLLLTALPQEHARRVLVYRLRGEHRSIKGAFRALVDLRGSAS